MTPLKRRAFAKALNQLKATGCSYTIIDEEGNTHEHGMSNSTGRKRRNNIGATDYAKTFLIGIQPGQMVTVPVNNDFDINAIAAAASHAAFALWGKDSYMTSPLEDESGVEVLRDYDNSENE